MRRFCCASGSMIAGGIVQPLTQHPLHLRAGGEDARLSLLATGLRDGDRLCDRAEGGRFCRIGPRRAASAAVAQTGGGHGRGMADQESAVAVPRERVQHGVGPRAEAGAFGEDLGVARIGDDAAAHQASGAAGARAPAMSCSTLSPKPTTRARGGSPRARQHVVVDRPVRLADPGDGAAERLVEFRDPPRPGAGPCAVSIVRSGLRHTAGRCRRAAGRSHAS